MSSNSHRRARRRNGRAALPANNAALLYPDAEPRNHRKDYQLASQLQDIVSAALQTAGNPILRDLSVVAVAVAGFHFRVTIGCPPQHSLSAASSAVQTARGYLRSEVADAVSRRALPSVRYEVVPDCLAQPGETP